jgi:hypothetical protein
LNLPSQENWSAPGTWVGLNYFHKGNYYGLFLLTFPLNVLDDRLFMVFRRKSGERKQFFSSSSMRQKFLHIGLGKEIGERLIQPLFFRKNDELLMKADAIYYIVGTQPVSL